VKEMRLAGIDSMEAANHFLETPFGNAHAEKSRFREIPAPLVALGQGYCRDVVAATGCRLRETILVPITSPETTNSTRRFC
jgi:hypothetical protein